MADRSFTLVEPHFHGDIQVGPRSIGEALDGPSTAEEGPPNAAAGAKPISGLVVLGIVAAIAVAIWRRFIAE